MSFRKSIAFEVSSEEVSKLLKALFGEPEKQHQTKGFSHPVLVSVKSGDGIGFDTGDFVAVTNKKNNVGLLLKANYDNPFSECGNLTVSKIPATSKDELVPGHTYMTEAWGETVFVKYLGHSKVLIRTRMDMSIITIETDKFIPHYEISVPSSNSK